MRQVYLIKEGHPCLLLFFAGWGMDENPFSGYNPAGCDWMICYDYRSLKFDYSLLKEYSSIRLIAWSMGVWAASQIFDDSLVRISESVAINGTNYPVDSEKGIDLMVFQGTLQGLNQVTLDKFFRRMCGLSPDLIAFIKKAPRRGIEELKDELRCIGEWSAKLSPSTFRWGRAIVGSRDKIFLPACQQRAWKNTCVEVRDIEHYSEKCFEEVFASAPLSRPVILL